MNITTTVIGRGRLGSALAAALSAGDPLGRGSDGAGADLVLLCVPDGEIAAAAAAVAPGRLVGHCSGATTLAPLAPHEAFSLHPLMTVTGPDAQFAGAGCAVAGATPRARAAARTSGASMSRSTPAVAARRSAAPSRVTRKLDAIDAAAW